MKLNSIASLGGKCRGPRRTSRDGPRLALKVKWCPFEGCNFATHILRKHLQTVHKLKNGQVLENYLRIANEYKGKPEQDEVQHYCANLKRKRSRLTEHSLSEPARKVLKQDELSDDSVEECTSERVKKKTTVKQKMNRRLIILPPKYCAMIVTNG